MGSILLHGLVKFITWLFFIGILGSTVVLVLVSIGDFKAVMGIDEEKKASPPITTEKTT